MFFGFPLFGSGINVMRFLNAQKPILGFMNEENMSSSLNVSNVLQLKAEFPNLIHLIEYRTLEQINKEVIRFLEQSQQQEKRTSPLHLVVDQG